VENRVRPPSLRSARRAGGRAKVFAGAVTAIEDAGDGEALWLARPTPPTRPCEPELRCVWVAQLRTELRTVLPRPVASPGWRRLPLVALPTAVAAYEQWLRDHPADDAADDQPPRAGSRPRQLPTNDHDVRHHTQTTMNWRETSRRLIIAANERRADQARHPLGDHRRGGRLGGG
jgi:hypothetical protein